MITSDVKLKKKQWYIGDRITWNTVRGIERNGIIISELKFKQIKSVRLPMLKRLAMDGMIPKLVIGARLEHSEGDRVATRGGIYTVAIFSTASTRKPSVSIQTIPRSVKIRASEHALDTDWVIKAQARYRAHKQRLRQREGGV